MRLLTKIFNKNKITQHEKILKMCQINYLSELQINKILLSYEDSYEAQEAIRKMMNSPDVSFLAKKLMPQIDKPTLNKTINAIDMVKATALGDIIGYKYEFVEHDYSQAKTMELLHSSALYTDDTMLSIATMKAILENDKNPNFAVHYKQAYLEHPAAGYGSAFAAWAMDKENLDGYHSLANGCVMRISFIPAYYDNLEDVIKYTIQSVMVTHNHIESVKASVVMAVCMWMAIHGYEKNDIFEYCKSHYKLTNKDIESLLFNVYYFDMDVDLKDVTQNNKTMFASYIVPYVIKCFMETDSYESCMREILSRFGDTDTACAIAGGLCFAYYKTTGFPLDELMQRYSVNI